MTTQEQYSVLRQPNRRLNIRIDLLNENDVVVGSFEGITIDGSLSIDGSSTYRRSGNLTMILDKKYNLIPKPDSKIWFNKRCAIKIGLKNYSDDIVWFNLGRFAIDEVDLNFNLVEKTLSCQLKDYMSFLDGNLAGILPRQTVIPVNTPISEAIKSLVSELGKFSIEDISINGEMLLTPYTIEKASGSSIFDLIQELINLYQGWDFYFNAEGYFIVEKIKDKSNDSVVETFDSGDKDFTLNSSVGIDFKNVRNAIYVWGRQLDDGTQIKWVYRNRWSRTNYSDLDLLTDKQIGDICQITSENNSYVYDGSIWELLDFKVVDIFNIESIGEKIHTYENSQLYNNEQAELRCQYELKQKSNFAETINFSIVPLYYLNIFDKIHINIDDEIDGDYLITSATIPLNIDGSMNIQATKLYY